MIIITVLDEKLIECKEYLLNNDNYIYDVMKLIGIQIKRVGNGSLNMYNKIIISYQIKERKFNMETHYMEPTVNNSLYFNIYCEKLLTPILDDYNNRNLYYKLILQNDDFFNEKFLELFRNYLCEVLDNLINEKVYKFSSNLSMTSFTKFLFTNSPCQVFYTQDYKKLDAEIITDVFIYNVDNTNDDKSMYNIKFLNTLPNLPTKIKLKIERSFLMNTNSDLNKITKLNSLELEAFIKNNLNELLKAITLNNSDGFNQYKLLSDLYKINKDATSIIISNLDIYIDNINKLGSINDSEFIKILIKHSKRIYIYDISSFFSGQIRNKNVIFANVIISIINSLNINEKILINDENCDNVIKIFESLSLIYKDNKNEFDRFIRFIKNKEKIHINYEINFKNNHLIFK